MCLGGLSVLCTTIKRRLLSRSFKVSGRVIERLRRRWQDADGKTPAPSKSQKFPIFSVTLRRFTRRKYAGSNLIGGLRTSVNPDDHIQLTPSTLDNVSRSLPSLFLSTSLPSWFALNPAHENACPESTQITAARNVERTNMNRDLDPVSPTHDNSGATRAGEERVRPETQPPRVRRLDTGREV
ncbi:hypothetical protein CMEL01_04756 [Colletotrichum melonis]|uniref:Uncharacterized protein n=1 Tax=Colletotrichum melonis TaxID=1209925 RepID=A0AAI9U9V1_9PEZI|nr:hypothetical protein CMEL01_04756 [Colletotrichum melonis]